MERGDRSRAVYLWSLLVALLTFPLIWLGGLVTTHDAGMAVPDWPGTFGYNLFLYPWSAWLYGPFDLLVEHGHRQLAAILGFFAILLVWVCHRYEARAWVRKCSWLLLLAIISQGILGGIRVLLDARIVALIHGICGPLVFAGASWMVMINSDDWYSASRELRPGGLRWVARGLFLLTIAQLALGAHLRHALPTWKPSLFTAFVHTHLLLASLITLLVFTGLFMLYRSLYRPHKALRSPMWCLVGLVFVQVTLGLGTWVANYGLPWQELNKFLANYTIAGRGFWESMIINGHQATGSLLIVCSLWLLCRVERRSLADRFVRSAPSPAFMDARVGQPGIAGTGSS